TVLPARAAGPDAKELKEVKDKAVAALLKLQKANGSFGPPRFAAGATALAVTALVKHGRGPDDPAVAKALKDLEGLVKKDGGIHAGGLANYTTCVAIMALKEANKDGKYDAVLKKAAAYLKKLQENDPASKGIRLGGVTYEGDGMGKPDMSNTHYFV